MQFFDKHKLHKHIEILYHYCDFKNGKVGVHLNGKKDDDYPRMSFILFTLSKAYAYGFIDDIDGHKKQELITLFWSIYSTASISLKESEMLYICLYGMRFLKNFNQEYTVILKDFETKKYGSLYAYPVSAYLYMSTYIECENLRKEYSFSKEIFLQCKKMFDFLLYSNMKETCLPFYFSELSAHALYVESHILQKANSVIQQKFEKGYLNDGNIFTSGVAKCMEDFARRGEFELLKSCFAFLEKRNVDKYKDYIHPYQKENIEYLYSENESSQYICLDTNAHLVHTYLNLWHLYEKTK